MHTCLVRDMKMLAVITLYSLAILIIVSQLINRQSKLYHQTYHVTTILLILHLAIITTHNEHHPTIHRET